MSDRKDNETARKGRAKTAPDRNTRLAEALRANLKRRKGQARARTDIEPGDPKT